MVFAHYVSPRRQESAAYLQLNEFLSVPLPRSGNRFCRLSAAFLPQTPPQCTGFAGYPLIKHKTPQTPKSHWGYTTVTPS